MMRKPDSPWSLAPGPRSRAKRAGFALLIVVTLLAFLVVLLVGLAAYTRIETAVAGNTQRQAQARENALLALNIALGQVQKHAGPDQRVTATAEAAAGVNGQKSHYTGVWRSDDGATGAAPLAWLTSGIERGTAEDITAAIPAARRAELVGRQTTGAANSVVAALQDLTATGIPGTANGSQALIGRYAWWVGDQGVKAPVAVPDTTASVTYAPFGDGATQNDLGKRIRQQIALGAGAADASGAPIFEPRDTNNTPLVRGDKIVAANQLAFLKNASNTAIGLTGARGLQQNFFAWSPNNYAVLANTRLGGLRQDLSIDPTLLGQAVAGWLDYTSYMEPADPAFSPPAGTFAIYPPYGADPLRRRYTMQSGPPLISPVLSFSLLSFNVRTLPTPGGNPSGTPQPLQVRLRGMFTLWNPYSSALVPENLRLEISGLPQTVDFVDTTTPTSSGTIPFASLFGGTVRFSLPWSASTFTSGDDRHSWLPGRTYSWTIEEDASGNAPPSGGYLCRLNSQNISTVSGEGVQRAIPGLVVDGSDACSIDLATNTQFVVTVIAERASGDVPLGSFTSPDFQPFHGTKTSAGASTYTPTFVYRLAENDNGPGSWLTTAGQDPREATLPGDAYSVGTTGYNNGPFPDLYPNVVKNSAPDRLLDRDVASFSYDEDTPVFELPRAPLLSIGQLQHLPVPGQRPFAIGNSWLGNADLNGFKADEVFDRFFFSGIASGVTPISLSGSLLLPNPLLKVLRLSTTGSSATLTDLQSAGAAQSSAFLLQGGAFNLNSTNAGAWTAVLRSLRYPAPLQFGYLYDSATSFSTGTTADSGIESIPSTEAKFFRFPQSAQEIFKADPGFAASTVAPPGPVDSASAANTHLFRQGMRTLDGAQTVALAASIKSLLVARQATAGPFRSMEEFLKPMPGADVSLLEQAIADAGLNAAIPEFSSQWLTQGDIMTGLAPVLFPRSDTFIIRAYGEVLNPATSTAAAPVVEGRAWCEATVQRVPEYFDKSQPEETAPGDLNTLNTANGRRFKVVSFRWLTRSDI